jgi:hypothetical protein
MPRPTHPIRAKSLNRPDAREWTVVLAVIDTPASVIRVSVAMA